MDPRLSDSKDNALTQYVILSKKHFHSISLSNYF